MPSVDWGKKPKAPDLDKFVQGGAKGETARVNANIPKELHRRMKVQCVLDGLDMTTVIIELLQQRFPEVPEPQRQKKRR